MNLSRLQEFSAAKPHERISEAKSKEEMDLREKMITGVESYFGTLETLEWNKLSTEDLRTMYNALLGDKLIKDRLK